MKRYATYAFIVGLTMIIIGAIASYEIIADWKYEEKKGDAPLGHFLSAQSEEKTVQIAAEAKKYTVEVKTEKEEYPAFWNNKSYFKNPMRLIKIREIYAGFGSGFIISSDGYIITAYHVVENTKPDKITIVKNGLVYKAELISTRPEKDRALLKINADSLPHAKISANKNLKEGATSYSAGFPLELGFIFSKGVINSPEIKMSLYDGVRVIQTDARVMPGNSGGPLINSRGEIIGTIVAYIPNTGYGYAIPLGAEDIEEMKKTKLDDKNPGNGAKEEK